MDIVVSPACIKFGEVAHTFELMDKIVNEGESQFFHMMVLRDQ
jgi:hypothetical protein